MRGGTSFPCLHFKHLGWGLAQSMNSTRVVKLIHSSLIHSFTHVLMHSINNFVEILRWEGENNFFSILYPIPIGVQTSSVAFMVIATQSQKE